MTHFNNQEANQWHIIRNNQEPHRDGADATRLRADHATRRAHASVDVVVEDELSDLSGLSTPGLPANH